MVRLDGEIDADNAEEIGQTLRLAVADQPRVLEVDLARVRHISAEGAAAFFSTLRAARANDVKLILTNANPQNRHVLGRLGLLRAVGAPEDGTNEHTL